MQTVGGGCDLNAVIARSAVNARLPIRIDAVHTESVIAGTEQDIHHFHVAGNHIRAIACGEINGRLASAKRSARVGAQHGVAFHLDAQPGVRAHAQPGHVDGRQLPAVGERVTGIADIECVVSDLTLEGKHALNAGQPAGAAADGQGVVAGAAVNDGIGGGGELFNAEGVVAAAQLDLNLRKRNESNTAAHRQAQAAERRAECASRIGSAAQLTDVQPVFHATVAVRPTVDDQCAADPAQIAGHGGQRQVVVVNAIAGEAGFRDAAGDKVFIRAPAAVDGQAAAAALNVEAVIARAFALVRVTDADDLNQRAAERSRGKRDEAIGPAVIACRKDFDAVQPDRDILARVADGERGRGEVSRRAIGGKAVCNQIRDVVARAVTVDERRAARVDEGEVIQAGAAVDGGRAAGVIDREGIDTFVAVDGGRAAGVIDDDDVITVFTINRGRVTGVVDRDRIRAIAAVEHSRAAGHLDDHHVIAAARVEAQRATGVVDRDRIGIVAAQDQAGGA